MEKSLVIGPSWVGDMVMAQVLFKLLKKANPTTQIDVVAPAWSAPLCERMPEVTCHLEMPLGHGQLQLRQRYLLAKALREHQYDTCYILPNSFKSALVPFWARIPNRIGWKKECRSMLLTDARTLDKEKFPLMIQRFAALAFHADVDLPEKLPVPRLVIDSEAADEALVALDLYLEAPVLSLCPGAEFGPSKRWPAHSYAKVAQHFLNEGWQVWLFGSANDSDVCQAIADACLGPVKNLAGKTTLAQAVDLLAQSKAVVSNDSGLMHIVSALNLPLAAVYGSSSPKFTPPLANRVLIHKQSLPCSPCFKRECPLKHHRCMTDLDAEPVIEALMSWAA